MRIMNAIKRFFKILLFRKKREPQAVTLYDTELLEMAQVVINHQQRFGEKRIPQAGEGTYVYFRPYKSLSVDPVSNHPAEDQ